MRSRFFPVYSENHMIEMEYSYTVRNGVMITDSIDARTFIQLCDFMERDARKTKPS